MPYKCVILALSKVVFLHTGVPKQCWIYINVDHWKAETLVDSMSPTVFMCDDPRVHSSLFSKQDQLLKPIK